MCNKPLNEALVISNIEEEKKFMLSTLKELFAGQEKHYEDVVKCLEIYTHVSLREC